MGDYDKVKKASDLISKGEKTAKAFQEAGLISKEIELAEIGAYASGFGMVVCAAGLILSFCDQPTDPLLEEIKEKVDDILRNTEEIKKQLDTISNKIDWLIKFQTLDKPIKVIIGCYKNYQQIIERNNEKEIQDFFKVDHTRIEDASQVLHSILIDEGGVEGNIVMGIFKHLQSRFATLLYFRYFVSIRDKANQMSIHANAVLYKAEGVDNIMENYIDEIFDEDKYFRETSDSTFFKGWWFEASKSYLEKMSVAEVALKDQLIPEGSKNIVAAWVAKKDDESEAIEVSDKQYSDDFNFITMPIRTENNRNYATLAYQLSISKKGEAKYIQNLCIAKDLDLLVSGKVFFFRNKHTNAGIDYYYSKTIEPCGKGGGGNHRWSCVAINGGASFALENMGGKEKFLDHYYSNDADDSPDPNTGQRFSNLVMSKDPNHPNHSWYITVIDDSTFGFINVKSQKCIEHYYSRTIQANGDRPSNDNRRWNLDFV